MSNNTEKLRELIQENRFTEARQLIKASNHPKKDTWLAELDKREAAYNPIPTSTNQEVSGKKAVATTEKPKPAPKLFLSILRVFIGGLIAFAIVPVVMILVDTKIMHFSQYLMNEDSRKIFTLTVGFALASAAAFGVIARLIAYFANLFAGIYYATLFAFVIPIWHYGSFYLDFGSEESLTSPFSAEAFTAYSQYLEGIPPDSLIAIIGAILLALATAFTIGSISEEELKRRSKSGRGLLRP